MSQALTSPVEPASSRDGLLTLVLCLLFGIFGAHRFYAGKTWTAVLQILTLGGLGIWTAIDFLFILFGQFTDDTGCKVDPWKDL